MLKRLIDVCLAAIGLVAASPVLLPVMFLVFLYNYSAGLALYWTVNNLLTVVQTKLTKSNQAAAAPPATVSPLTPLSKKKK